MTEPRTPGTNDPADPADAAVRAARRGRHAAPDEEAAGAVDPPEPTDTAGAEPDAAAEADTAGADAAAEPSEPVGMDAAAEPSEPVEPSEEPLPATSDGGQVRRRHAAEDSSLRLPVWMIAVAGALAVGLLAWLVIALAGGGDDDEQASTTASADASDTARAPSPVDVASLPAVLCMGSSYVMIDTGRPAEQLLADPDAVEAQFPGSTLSTIPPGCVAGSTTRDEVVLALGPFPTIDEACTAGKALQGTGFTAYAGSATAGLTPTTC